MTHSREKGLLPYKRVLLKLSGEALQNKEAALCPQMLENIAGQLKAVHEAGVEVAIVVGGGNIFRGLAASAQGMNRSTADYMGMMATVINALAVQDCLARNGLPSRALSALAVERVVDLFTARTAADFLTDGEILVLAAGTGNPFFTTDTAAALRAAEIDADILLKATKVDGVYSADPVSSDSAEFFPVLSFSEVLEKNLRVMDSAAFSMCRDNNIPVGVFNIFHEDSIRKAVLENKIGTLIS